VRLADRGVRTLLLSTDSAHSLGDVLGTALGAEPVAVTSNLHAVHLDTQRRFEQVWNGVQRFLLDLLRRAGMDAVTAAEVTVLPGVEEVLALLAVREYAEGGDYDALVVDCAPTAETLRLLALPDALAWYLRAVLPAQRRMAKGLRPLAAVLGRPEALPPEGLFDAVVALHDELVAVRDLLERTGTVRLVLTPEAMVVSETRRTYTALALYGYRVDGVIANRLVPRGRDAWRSAWNRAQAARLDDVTSSFTGLPLYRALYAPAEPLGLDALRAVAAELYGEQPGLDPLATGPDRELLSVVASDNGFELSLELPLAVRGEATVARAGDDLVVTLGSHRRVIALPSVLRRCEVAGGRLVEGDGEDPARLVVRFRPDARVWPDTVPFPGGSAGEGHEDG
jgi:arsenite/tail-anchored protein-transporting ATPase